MITDQFHPLDDVTLFGHCIHGLVSGSINEAFVEVDGVQFPIPVTPTYRIGQGTLQIVRHPAAGPVALSPEVLAAERAQGRVWQNFTLLKSLYGQEVIYGTRVEGWIFIDSLGRRWLAIIDSQPQAQPGSSYTIALRLVPFGYLDGQPEGMEPVELSLTCADIQQIGSGARVVRARMANSTGSQRLLELKPVSPFNALPSGYLMINLSDDEGVPSGTLTVLRSQAQMRGDWDTTHPTTTNPNQLLTFHNMLLGAELEGAVYPEGPDIPYFPVGGGTATVTVTGPVEIDQTSPLDAYTKGDVSVSCGRTGRLLLLAFDESDALVPITFDTRYEFTGVQPDWEGSASGEITSFGDGVHINDNPWSVVQEPEASLTRTVSERLESTITLRRGGVEVCHVTNVRSYSATLTAALAANSSGWAWASGYLGRGGGSPGSFVFAERVNTSAASAPTGAMAEKGGPWPASTATTPGTVTGSSGMEYLASIPLGSSERDADVIDFAFVATTYRAIGEADQVAFNEVTSSSGVIGPGTRELALAFPHADLLAREFDARPVAYDPISHAVAVAPENGMLFSFV